MAQHVVFGAGLIGGFLGGVLRAKGFPVSLVARPSLKSRFENTLKLTDFHGNETHAQGFTFYEPGDSSAEFLWLTVKCTAVSSVIEELRPLVSAKTVILCCQNGLGSDQSIRKAFPDNTVLRVMVQFNVANIAQAHLHRGSDGDVTIEYSPRIVSVAQKLNSALMPVQVSDDMEAVLWAKLQLNLANAINGLANIPVKSMLEQRAYRKVIALLMEELLAVVKAKQLSLPKLTGLPADKLPGFLAVPNWLFRLVGGKMLAIDPTVRTSMWQDLHHERLTEVDFLNGAVVNVGDELGVPCPCNQSVVDLIHAVERGKCEQGMSADALLSHLKSAGV